MVKIRSNFSIANMGLFCNLLSFIILLCIFIFPLAHILFYFLNLFSVLSIVIGVVALIKENSKIKSIVCITLGVIFLLVLSYLKDWNFIIRILSRGG